MMFLFLSYLFYFHVFVWFLLQTYSSTSPSLHFQCFLSFIVITFLLFYNYNTVVLRWFDSCGLNIRCDVTQYGGHFSLRKNRCKTKSLEFENIDQDEKTETPLDTENVADFICNLSSNAATNPLRVARPSVRVYMRKQRKTKRYIELLGFCVRGHIKTLYISYLRQCRPSHLCINCYFLIGSQCCQRTRRRWR